jgi:hypothetical protein
MSNLFWLLDAISMKTKQIFFELAQRTDAGVTGNSPEGVCSRQQVRAVLDGGKA